LEQAIHTFITIYEEIIDNRFRGEYNAYYRRSRRMDRQATWVAVGVVSATLIGLGTIVVTVFGQEIKAALVPDDSRPLVAQQVVEGFVEAQLDAGKAPQEKKPPPDCCTADALVCANFDSCRSGLLARKARYAPTAKFVNAEILRFHDMGGGRFTARIKVTTKLPLLSESGKSLPGNDLCMETADWTFEKQGGRTLIKNRVAR
jgi:hypothetical protein